MTLVAPALSRIGDFAGSPDQPRNDTIFDPLRRAGSVGRPIGERGFIEGLEKTSGRTLLRRKRGPKAKNKDQFGSRHSNIAFISGIYGDSGSQYSGFDGIAYSTGNTGAMRHVTFEDLEMPR